MANLLDLRSVLIWFISGGGGGVVAWALIPKVPWLSALAFEPKRWAAMILAGLVGSLATCLSVLIFQDAAPADWRGWVIKLGGVFLTAAIAGQLAHARDTTVQINKAVAKEVSESAAMDKAADCDCEGSCECK